MASIRAKNVVTLIVMSIGLLVTLPACENSKHAEVMSTEDLWADGQTATVPDTGTQTERQAQSDETGGSFEGQSIDEEPLGLSEPLVFAPEPPPGPASPARDASGSDAEATPSSPGRVLPEGYSQSPRVEGSPASGYVPDSPPQVFHEARVREFGVSYVAEPEMEIAKLDPSDFVSEAPEPALEASRVETGVESELADVFFDFDQYTIRSSAIPVLEKNAELLKETYKAFNVLIEGHCDERGTSEYNMGLGQRRADAAKKGLIGMGVAASRIETVSFGKEKPVVHGNDEAAWSQNRVAITVVK